MTSRVLACLLCTCVLSSLVAREAPARPRKGGGVFAEGINRGDILIHGDTSFQFRASKFEGQNAHTKVIQVGMRPVVEGMLTDVLALGGFFEMDYVHTVDVGGQGMLELGPRMAAYFRVSTLLYPFIALRLGFAHQFNLGFDDANGLVVGADAGLAVRVPRTPVLLMLGTGYRFDYLKCNGVDEFMHGVPVTIGAGAIL